MGRGFALALALALAGAGTARPQPVIDQDQIDLTGRQNLTLGAGARAYGMGGAFLARADDATAASWNPAGLSYLRLPELSVVGNYNSFVTERASARDQFEGGAFDFAAVTWPVAIREIRGAVQVSYQRAIGFDGSREIDFGQGVRSDGRSDGGFDVLAFGTGFRLTRRLRAGFTVNRWLNGYDQKLTRQIPGNLRPLREFTLDFRPRGWSANLGIIFSPIETLNLAAVLKTPFTADVTLARRRVDTWASDTEADQVTFNQHESDDVRLEFPASYGFGISWRPRENLTLSADFTRTGWSSAFILDYFSLPVTPRREDPSVPPDPPPPVVFDRLPYPTLGAVPEFNLAVEQVDAEQIRVGVEYVLLTNRVNIPLRAGYFNDRQITAFANEPAPRFNGVTVGTGIIFGSLLLDVAYLYEFGEYDVGLDSENQPENGALFLPTQVRTQRFFASLIYRFGGIP